MGLGADHDAGSRQSSVMRSLCLCFVTALLAASSAEVRAAPETGVLSPRKLLEETALMPFDQEVEVRNAVLVGARHVLFSQDRVYTLDAQLKAPDRFGRAFSAGIIDDAVAVGDRIAVTYVRDHALYLRWLGADLA